MRKFIKTLLMCLSFLVFTGAKADNVSQKIVLTSDNTVVMDETFTAQSVAEVTLAARALDSKLPSGEPLYLVLYSGGGSIDAGLELIGNLKNLNRPVHTVTLFSASMAFQTVQGLGTRYVIANGTLMSHKARGGFEGEFPGQFDSRYAWYLKKINRLDETTVARSGGKLTMESYRALYANEFWCDGQECVNKGVADQVVSVQCDKSLDGTAKKVMHLSFMGMPIEVTVSKARCPTITGILSVEVKANGRNVNLNDADDWKYNDVLAPLSFDAIRALKAAVDQAVNSVATTALVPQPY